MLFIIIKLNYLTIWHHIHNLLTGVANDAMPAPTPVRIRPMYRPGISLAVAMATQPATNGTAHNIMVSFRPLLSRKNPAIGPPAIAPIASSD